MNQLSTKDFFKQESVQGKFKELLAERSTQFITTVLQIVNSNAMLANADPMSIYNAAATAAVLDLPINPNLGFAYIIPFNERQKDGSSMTKAQFQIGYKGFIQLAQRSGRFKAISAAPIYEGQIVENNPLTGFKFDFTKRTSDNVIGYAAYFALLNGYEHTLYMSVDDLKAHGRKFSQTFKKGYGLWADSFDSMAQKTVIKLLLSKYAPLSIEMEKAVIADQSIVNNADTMDVTYIDNTPEVVTQEDKEKGRIELLVASLKTKKEAAEVRKSVPEQYLEFFDAQVEFAQIK